MVKIYVRSFKVEKLYPLFIKFHGQKSIVINVLNLVVLIKYFFLLQNLQFVHFLHS